MAFVRGGGVGVRWCINGVGGPGGAASDACSAHGATGRAAGGRGGVGSKAATRAGAGRRAAGSDACIVDGRSSNHIGARRRGHGSCPCTAGRSHGPRLPLPRLPVRVTPWCIRVPVDVCTSHYLSTLPSRFQLPKHTQARGQGGGHLPGVGRAAAPPHHRRGPLAPPLPPTTGGALAAGPRAAPAPL